MLSGFYDHKDKFTLGILSAPMLGFKNEKFLRSVSSVMNIFAKDTDYLLAQNLIWGKKRHMMEMI